MLYNSHKNQIRIIKKRIYTKHTVYWYFIPILTHLQLERQKYKSSFLRPFPSEYLYARIWRNNGWHNVISLCVFIYLMKDMRPLFIQSFTQAFSTESDKSAEKNDDIIFCQLGFCTEEIYSSCKFSVIGRQNIYIYDSNKNKQYYYLFISYFVGFLYFRYQNIIHRFMRIVFGIDFCK